MQQYTLVSGTTEMSSRTTSKLKLSRKLQGNNNPLNGFKDEKMIVQVTETNDEEDNKTNFIQITCQSCDDETSQLQDTLNNKTCKNVPLKDKDQSADLYTKDL